MGNNASTLMSCAGTTPKKKQVKSNLTSRPNVQHDSDTDPDAENQVSVQDGEHQDINGGEPVHRPLSRNESDTSALQLNDPSTPLTEMVSKALGSGNDDSNVDPAARGDLPYVDEEEEDINAKLSDVNSLSFSDSHKNVESRSASLSHSSAQPHPAQVTKHNSQDKADRKTTQNAGDNKLSHIDRNVTTDGEDSHGCNYHSNESLARYDHLFCSLIFLISLTHLTSLDMFGNRMMAANDPKICM